MTETGTRDIDFVLVTGAGASCAFGAGERLPLMTDWVAHLVQKLAMAPGGYKLATGLRADMDATAFEDQLGRFLRQVLAFDQVRDPVLASRQFQMQAPQMSLIQPEGVLEGWYDSAASHFGQIVALIRDSLYELFAGQAVDITRATEAYRALLHAVGVSASTKWVYATTNYDAIGENVIRHLDWLPDWGEPPGPPTSGERSVKVDGLLGGMPRYVPVLHVHGRVGWYRRPDGSVYSTPTVRHDEAFGVPVVMLPDPEKAYDTDPVIDSLWRQFNEALARATRVLVLGHSLNDDAIVEALRENVEPLRRIAVTVLADETNRETAAPGTEALVKKANEQLAGATVIPIRFGDGRLHPPRQIQGWLEASA